MGYFTKIMKTFCVFNIIEKRKFVNGPLKACPCCLCKKYVQNIGFLLLIYVYVFSLQSAIYVIHIKESAETVIYVNSPLLQILVFTVYNDNFIYST